jgi:hypothetical protein
MHVSYLAHDHLRRVLQEFSLLLCLSMLSPFITHAGHMV